MRSITAPSRRSLLSVTGVLETATGLALLAIPSVVVDLLLGSSESTPPGVTVSRVAGVALVALGVACWLARQEDAGRCCEGIGRRHAPVQRRRGRRPRPCVAEPGPRRHRFLAGGPGSRRTWPPGAPRCCRSEAGKSRGENLLRVHGAAPRDTPDFATLEARVRETQGEVRRVFLALVGGK